MRSRLPLACPTLALGLLLPTGAQASDLRAARPGSLVAAPNGQGRMELLIFDAELPSALLEVPLEGRLRIVDWPVAPGVRRALLVTRHDVYAPDARIVALDGKTEVEVPRSRQVFFWGAIEDDPESTVMIALDPVARTLSGFAIGAHGSFDLLPPTADRGGRHAVAASSSLRPAGKARSFVCGQADLPIASAEPSPAAVAASGETEPYLLTSVHTAVLAFDTDNEAMGTKFSNNTSAAANWLAQAVAGMSAIYERDVFVRFHQGYTILRLSTAADPYVQAAVGNADVAKLTEFTDYWAANYGGVLRTLALMISGKQPGGGASGIAWVGVLCNTGFGFSFNQVFTTGTTVGSDDVELLSHEVGHNFGSRHTHCTDTNPASAGTQPIDYCYDGETCSAGPWMPNPGVSCPAPFAITPLNGATVNNVRGTVMSYCHLLGGCSITNVFHPQTVSVLSPHIDAAVGACIFPLGANPAPSVGGVNPVFGSTSGGTAVTITGTNFRSPATVAFSDLVSGPAASSVVVVNSTTITALTPPHAAGLTDLVVMNPDQQTGTLGGAFTYRGPPAITSINPNSGPTLGGTPVTITGSNFVAPATVRLGGTLATGVAVASPTTITATTPAHAAGIVSVVVQSSGLTTTLPSGFFYFTPPVAASFYTLTPCRLVDTRNPNGPLGGPAIPGSTRRNFTLTGVCGVPASATAISVNLAVTGPAAAGFLKLFPGDGLPPLSSAINFSAGQTRGNNAVVLLATDGSGVLAVTNGSTGSVHFILDVNGYFQ